MYGRLTMFTSTSVDAQTGRCKFQNAGCHAMNEWYSHFDRIRAVRQNEILLAALLQAWRYCNAFVRTEEGLHLFVQGDLPVFSLEAEPPSKAYTLFPWQSMKAQRPSEIFDVTAEKPDADPISILLSKRRIALAPGEYEPMFVDGDGIVMEPSDEFGFGYHTETLQAVEIIARSELDGFGNYFGNDILEAVVKG